MDPMTLMMIMGGVQGGTNLMSSILGNRPSNNQMASSGIQTNSQFKSPFTMPDQYKKPDYTPDPKQSILGSADSLASRLRLPYHPSNYFGQYINF